MRDIKERETIPVHQVTLDDKLQYLLSELFVFVKHLKSIPACYTKM